MPAYVRVARNRWTVTAVDPQRTRAAFEAVFAPPRDPRPPAGRVAPGPDRPHRPLPPRGPAALRRARRALPPQASPARPGRAGPAAPATAKEPRSHQVAPVTSHSTGPWAGSSVRRVDRIVANCRTVKNRRKHPRSCGSGRLMTTTDPRACPSIILELIRPGLTRRCRPAPAGRSPAPAGVSRHDPRPTNPQRTATSAHRHPRLGRRRGLDRPPVPGHDRRVGRGCPAAGPGGARRPPRGAQPLGRALRGHHPPHPGPPGRRALGSAIGAWLADRQTRNQRRRAVAVDGKTLRGARSGGRQIHLLAAMEHTTRAVLAQHQVNGAPGEVPGFAPLLPTWTWPGS
jgi:hypothetical protein